MRSLRSQYVMAVLCLLALAFAGGGCAISPGDPNQPPPQVRTVTYENSGCNLTFSTGRHNSWYGRDNSGCWYDGRVSTVITTGGSHYAAPVAMAGQGAFGGLFPPSVEQQLGVAPNECFVDKPEGGRQQVQCVLGRAIKGYFDDLGGRAVVFQ